MTKTRRSKIKPITSRTGIATPTRTPRDWPADESPISALTTLIGALEGRVLSRRMRTQLARNLRARVIEARAESYVQRCEDAGIRLDLIDVGNLGDELHALRTRPAESLLGADHACSAELHASLVDLLAMKLVTFDEFESAVYECIIARFVVELAGKFPKQSEDELRRLLCGSPDELQRFMARDALARASSALRRPSRPS